MQIPTILRLATLAQDVGTLKITTTRTQRSWVIVGHPSAADLPRQSRGLLEDLIVRYGRPNHEELLLKNVPDKHELGRIVLLEPEDLFSVQTHI